MTILRHPPTSWSESPAEDRPGIGRRASFALSALAGTLALAACLIGLLVDGVYGEPVSVAAMLRGYDLVTLAAALPLLGIAMVGAHRGSDRAEMVWPAILAYLAYTYAYYVFGTSFNDAFLLHVMVFSAATFALIMTLSSADVARIADHFSPRTPTRLVAAVVGLLAVALGGLWVYQLLHLMTTGDVIEGSALVEPDLVVHLGIALDLALLVPAYAVAAALLWRKAAWGYVLGVIVLLSGVLHQVSYLVAMPFQVAADVPGAVSFDVGEPVVLFLYLLAAAPLLWNAGRRTRPQPDTANGGHY